MSLQLLTSYAPEQADRLYLVVMEAMEAGCEKIQFSWGNCTDKELYKKAEEIRRLTSDYGVEMIVNNRLDVANAVGADMLWIGQGDVPFHIARELVSPSMKIGLSLDHAEQALDSEYDGVDCFGVGPIFKTITKENAPDTWGLSKLEMARKFTNKPLVAIGGITPSNARQVLDSGADELAVIGGVYRSQNIRGAIESLLNPV